MYENVGKVSLAIKSRVMTVYINTINYILCHSSCR